MHSPLLRGAAILSLAVVSSLSSAHAQTPCADRDMIVKRLNDKYGETVRSMGLNANNQIMEVFASEKTGTWTIALTSADGQTCLIASGNSFEGLPDGIVFERADDA